MNATTNDTPKIYVASLSDYNAGRLHGAWIDIEEGMTANDLQEKVNAILIASPEPIAEEWAIHDYDNFPNMGEYPSIETIVAMADVLAEVNENALGDAFTAWIDDSSYNAEHPERFQNCYMGEYDSEEDYARGYVESTGMLDGVNETLANYFDYESFARDLFFDLTSIQAPGGGIYVFDSNR